MSSSPGKSGFKAFRPLSRLAGTTPVRLSSVPVSCINLQLGLAQSGGDGRSAKKRTLDPEEGQRNEEILNHLPKNIVQVTATLP